jgi:hypothetical protein
MQGRAIGAPAEFFAQFGRTAYLETLDRSARGTVTIGEQTQ